MPVYSAIRHLKSSVLIGAALCLLLSASMAHTAPQPVLPDGFLIPGLDGELRQTAGGDYAFTFDKAISTDKGSVKAGQAMELLPSTTLEYMLRDMGENPSMSLRLWGTVTVFHGRNYIFPSYYLRVASAAPHTASESASPTEPNVPKEQPVNAPVINDPNDEIRIPEELMAELKATRRVIDVAPAPAPAEQDKAAAPAAIQETADAMVVDRYGIMMQTAGDSSWAFRFDGLGRNVSLISFRLLPCEVLQRLELERKPSDLGPRRYRIAGVLTRFRGEYYVLPTRVIRAYDNGNFGK